MKSCFIEKTEKTIYSYIKPYIPIYRRYPMNSCYATGSLVPLDSISCLNKFKSIKCCQIIIKFTFNRFASASYTWKKIRYYSKG